VGYYCIIEIDGVPYQPGPSYFFDALPRIGEEVSLPLGGDGYPMEFTVRSVRHIPEQSPHEPAKTVLFVSPND
jgi:hypothetical protein